MTLESDNESDNAGAAGMAIHEMANRAPSGAQGKKKLPRWFWPVGIAVTVLLLIYLWQVFMAAFQRTQTRTPGYFVAREGRSFPEYSGEVRSECESVYDGTTLTPYADNRGAMHRFPEFREHGSIWLLESAKTTMYEAELLKHPRCLQFRLQEIAAAKNRVIFVIYDKATRSDVLVIRNYP